MSTDWKADHSKDVNFPQTDLQVKGFYNIPARLFIDIDKFILIFTQKGEETRIDETIFEKNEVGGNHSTQL